MAVLMISDVSFSTPVSLLITVISADASSTALFTFCCLAALSDQFSDQGNAWLNVFPHHTLGSLNSPLHCCDLQPIILHTQNHLISCFDTQSLAIGSRNDDAAICGHCGKAFCSCHIIDHVTYYSILSHLGNSALANPISAASAPPP